jgi:hypothetical protein
MHKHGIPTSSRNKKIIATTDTSLKIFAGKGDTCDLYYNLPQPSQQFIEKYIEFYNKGKVITDVLVEYQQIAQYNTGEPILILKLDKNNTITIKKSKDSWNREEVIKLINQYTIEMVSEVKNYHRDKWIEENI